VTTLAGALIGALLVGGGAAGTAPSRAQLDPLASEDVRSRLADELAALGRPLSLVVFTTGGEKAKASEAAERLAAQLAEFSDKITTESVDFEGNRQRATSLGVVRAPCIAVLAGERAPVRFYGVPGGKELDVLVATLRRAAGGDHGLSAETLARLADLPQETHIEVFVTLTCRFCPQAAETACRLALASERVKADIIELSSFMELAERHGIRSVPFVMVNGREAFRGVKSEEEFIAAVAKAAGLR